MQRLSAHFWRSVLVWDLMFGVWGGDFGRFWCFWFWFFDFRDSGFCDFADLALRGLRIDFIAFTHLRCLFLFFFALRSSHLDLRLSLGGCFCFCLFPILAIGLWVRFRGPRGGGIFVIFSVLP